MGWAYSNITIKNGVGHLVFDKETLSKLGLHPRKVSIIVNFLGIIKELKAWTVFVEYDKFIRVNLRSRHDYDIRSIAIQYDGGGHKNASGALIYNWGQYEEVIKKIEGLVN